MFGKQANVSCRYFLNLQSCVLDLAQTTKIRTESESYIIATRVFFWFISIGWVKWPRLFKRSRVEKNWVPSNGLGRKWKNCWLKMKIRIRKAVQKCACCGAYIRAHLKWLRKNNLSLRHSRMFFRLLIRTVLISCWRQFFFQRFPSTPPPAAER